MGFDINQRRIDELSATLMVGALWVPAVMKMGWSEVKRLPIGVLPSGPKAMVKMVSSRVPAALWSEDTSVGLAGSELADPNLANALLAHAPKRGFRTDRTPEYLAWRTALEPLKYRVLLADERDPAKGGTIFRLKRRGTTVEAAIVEQLVPNARVGARLVWDVVNRTKADYAIGLLTGPSSGLIPMPVPGMGPLLTARPLAATPPEPGAWRLTLADVELF